MNIRKRSGIYKIENTVNGKIYIGSAVDLRMRRNKHFSDLRKNKHPNSHLQSAFNKYGEESFFFSAILLCDKENLILYEQMALDSLRPKYNKNPRAESTLGYRYSEETKQKFRDARKNKPPEWHAALSEMFSRVHKGRTAWNKGVPMTDAAKKHLSEINKGKPGNNLGRKFSEEARHNMSEARKAYFRRKREGGGG